MTITLTLIAVLIVAAGYWSYCIYNPVITNKKRTQWMGWAMVAVFVGLTVLVLTGIRWS
jgi:hypothetical protein